MSVTDISPSYKMTLFLSAGKNHGRIDFFLQRYTFIERVNSRFGKDTGVYLTLNI